MIPNFGNITASGVRYRFPDIAPAHLHWIDPKGHENYFCPDDGGLSGTSSNPRTELRETDENGDDYNWTVGDARHSFSATLRVELTGKVGKTICAQIHAHKAPNPFVMVTWWKGEIRVDYRETPDGDARKVIAMPWPLGKPFKIFWIIYEDRLLHINLQGESTDVVISEEWDKYPFYKKRGAYIGGWVVYESSELRHEPVGVQL
jgi:hypothetical protein